MLRQEVLGDGNRSERLGHPVHDFTFALSTVTVWIPVGGHEALADTSPHRGEVGACPSARLGELIDDVVLIERCSEEQDVDFQFASRVVIDVA